MFKLINALLLRWFKISDEAKADGTGWKVGVRWAGLVVTFVMMGLLFAFLVYAIVQAPHGHAAPPSPGH